MAHGVGFFDNDGSPVSIGDTVLIPCEVVSVEQEKVTDKFFTVTIRLKHNIQGMKCKIDGNTGIVPSCVLTKDR